MLFAVVLMVIIVKLCIESAQRRDADSFAKWMQENGPDRYVSSKEMKGWVNLYNSSKHK